ncbi:MAG: hypothetical protein JW932_14855 [Deltaproteobacteria bacterium]|nr:hypothetical protein [Deltaproteobacteria bacterium]
MNKTFKGFLTILPIVASVFVTVYLVTHRVGPAQKQTEESIRALRVIKTASIDLVPRVIGYGVARPGWVWEAVAEVKGTVLSVNQHLKSGEWIEEKSVLIQIDPTEYELALARLEAGVEETNAKIKELTEEEKNTQSLIAIEQRSLELAQKSFDRKIEALKNNTLSQDTVDREERNFLQQKQSVQRLVNSLALIPSKRKALNSALAVHQSNIKQARIDLARTTIIAPFDCRLGDVSIEAGQFLRAGQSLFKAHGTAVTEVEALFRFEELRNLLSEQMRKRFQPGLSTGEFKQLFNDVRVLVSLQSGDWSAQWDARIERLLEAVDPKTREIKIVVSVDRPYEKAIPGERPPLTSGMFCRVELQGPVRAKSIVLPRSSIQNNDVFVIDRENRLQKKQVEVDFTQSEFAVIRSGVSIGELVVVSDASPAIMGVKVLPEIDDGLQEHITTLSQGERAKQ